MASIRVNGTEFLMSDRSYELICEGARLATDYADAHESGQLRLGVPGEQRPLLPLPDEQIPTSVEETI